MASRKEELKVDLVATDKLSKVVDAAADKVERLDGTTANVTVDASEGAGLAAASGDLKEIDGGTYKATVDASAGAGLTAVDGDLKEIDGGTFRATVDASVGAGLAGVVGDLKEIDGGTYRATVDASSGSGLSGLLSDIDGIPGTLSSGMGILSGAATAGGAIGLAAGAMAGLATHAMNWRTDVQEVANLTGAPLADVSAFLSIWQGAGFQKGDLLDVVAQMVGVLETSPGIADQLGIDLTEAKNPLDLLIQAIGALNSDQLTANEKILLGSQLFGEEGVRQINGLVTAVEGDLTGAIEDVPEALIVTEEEAQKAVELKQNFAELKAIISGWAVEMGGNLIGPLQTALDLVTQIEEKTGVNPIELGMTPPGGADLGSLGDSADQIRAERAAAEAASWDIVSFRMEHLGETAEEARRAVGLVGDATEEAAGQAEPLAEIMSPVAEAFEDAADKANDFADALSTVFDPAMNLAESTDQLEANIDALSVAFEENGSSLSNLTEQGRANREQFRENVQGALAHAEAMVENGATAEEAAEFLNDYRDELVAQATQLGYNEDDVNDYIDSLGLTPDNVATAIELTGKAEADRLIQEHNERLDEIPPEVSTAIRAAIAAGDLAEAQRLLDSIPDEEVAIRPYLTKSHFNVTVGVNGGTTGNGVSYVGIGMASGGYVNRPTAAVVGEAGEEVVLPLSDPRRMAALLGMPEVGPRVAAAFARLSPAGGHGGGGRGGDVWHVEVNMPPGSNGDDVLRALQQVQRRRGPLPLRVAG